VRSGAAAAALGLLLAGLGPATASDGQPARGQSAAKGVRLLLVGRFREPTYITAPPGDRGRRFVVERAGRIRVLRGSRALRRPFLDIRGRVQTGGESGLLSMAFAPDYARSRKFYVYFTDNSGFIRVEEFQASSTDPDRALPGSRRLVLLQRHHRFNHKGGQLQFGPDGLLYMGLGDGGGGGDPDHNAQNRGRLLGKILRMDPRPAGGRPYRIPAGNPFARGGGRGEVFAYGLRNPYRFSFDRQRGHLVIGDVGQDAVEEVDFVPRRKGHAAPHGGENFGWPVFEGRRRYGPGRAPGHVRPVLQRTHSQGFCTIIGGYVIRDRSLGRRLYGRYVYGDLCDPRLRTARLGLPRASADRAFGVRVPMLVSFGEDARGRVYAVSLRGPVYRLAPR
jgi:glucose/arabinose dehydrogenase